MSELILITGGAGFIGRTLAERCLEQGHDVAIYDDFSAGSQGNLQGIDDYVEVIEGDVLDHAKMRKVFERTGYTRVFHLAARHFIPYCNAHPLDTLRVNVEGTASVLQAAHTGGVRVFVLASTGAVYACTEDPLDEHSSRIHPPDIYGLSKLLAERVVEHFSETTGFTCATARVFNTYGPYETNPHLIPHIIHSLKEHPEFVELGNTNTKRDYIYVQDVADGLFAISGIAREYAVYNVGTGEEFSAAEIVNEIARLSGTAIEIRHDPKRLRAVDKMHQIAGVARLWSASGWKAKWSLANGLQTLLVHEGLLIDPSPVSEVGRA